MLWRQTVFIYQGNLLHKHPGKDNGGQGSFQFLCSLDVRDPVELSPNIAKPQDAHAIPSRDPCGDKLRPLPATSTTLIGQ